MKKWIAFLLALCMLLGQLPAGAFAADEVSPVPFQPEQPTQNAVQSSGLTWPEEPYSEGLEWAEIGFGGPGTGYRSEYTDIMIALRNAFRGSCLVVPGEYMQLPVDTIWNNAFENADHLEQAFLNSAAIENDAFLNCVNLTNVVFGDRMTRIGATAFAGCDSIQYNVYGGARYLGTIDNPYHALICAENTDITALTIHPDTRTIADEAFAGCTGLQSVTVPANVRFIGQSAFRGCTGLTEVAIPSGIIADSAFADCSALRSVTIGSGVTQLMEDAFAGCTALGSVYISDLAAWCAVDFANAAANPLYSAGNLYLNDELVRELVIPEGLTHISAYAFAGGRCVNAVWIPASVAQIGRGAFANTELWHILYEGTMEQWDTIGYHNDARIHYQCTGNEGVDAVNKTCQLCQSCTHHYVLLSDTSTCTQVGKDGEASYECDRCGHTYTEKVAAHDRWLEPSCTEPRRCGCGCGRIDNTSESLGGHLWQEATCIAPKTCSRCGETEFDRASHKWDILDCTQDKTCTVCGVAQAAGKHYYSEGICLDCPSRCSTGLDYGEPMGGYYVVGLGDCTDAEVVIPENHNGLIVYGIYGFASDTVTGITLPDTVGKILDYGFANCTALEEIVLPDSVRSIGDNAFRNCGSLTRIEIPAGVPSIGEYAFQNCANLTEIMIPASVQKIGHMAFAGCPVLERIHIADVAAWCSVVLDFPFETSKELYLDNEKITQLEIPEGVTSIADYVFADCEGIEKIILPNSVTTIGNSAFAGCIDLSAVDFADGLTHLGEGAFARCTAITEVVLPESLTTLGRTAFMDCTMLESVYIPGSVKLIDQWTFSGCTALKELTIGEGVTTIGTYAFSGCSGLESVTLPEGVTTIEKQAFTSCSGLRSITLPASLTTIGVEALGYCGWLEAIYYMGTRAQWEAVNKAEGWDSYTDRYTLYYPGECAAYGHAWVEATCTEVKYCPVCGTAEGEALGHDYQDVVIEPTCEESGYTNRVCSRCNDTIYVDGSYQNPLGHEWVEATCTEGSHCTRCGESGGTPARGHSEYSYTEPATCTEPGYTFHGCYRCDYTYLTDEVPALGHTPGSGPNCYGPQICEVCKIELQPALGHDWADATCTAPKTCSRCGLTEGAALDHNYQAEVTAPTCTEEGYTTYTCSRCSDSYVADKQPAQGHHYENGACTVCGVDYVSEGLSYGEVYDDDWNIIAYYVSGIGDCEDKDLIVPATHNGLPVTGIAESAFEWAALTSIILPDSVTTIDAFAFRGCTSLTRADLGNGLTSIGICAFDGCSALAKIDFPNSLQTIEERAFADCRGLTEVAFPAGVTTIGVDAFNGCGGLTSVTVPATVTSLGAYAFANCDGLTSAILGTDISAGAFNYCTNLKNVVICDGVTVIDASAFNRCNQLTVVTIPASVTQIGTSAFIGDWNLWHVLYLGTQTQWNAITVNNYNDCLTNATIHYNCTGDEITDLEGKICRICNCPHNYDTQTTQPTCTTDGSTVYRCTLCGHSYTEIISAPGHSWLDATCEAAKTCSVCGETEGEALGHDWKNATCTVPKTCSRCGIAEGEAPGHTAADAVREREVAPGCVTDGSYDSVVYCYVCSAELSRKTIAVSAPGHDYQPAVTAPTCTQEGFTTYTCSVCGDSYEADRLPALGHSWTDADCTDPKTCTVCGTTEGEALGHNYVDGYCTRCGSFDGSFSLGLTFAAYNGGYMVSGLGSCTDTHVKIPAKHNGLLVIAIGAQAFVGQESITAISIPDSVTLIGYGAFNACTGLTELVIPDGVTAIYGSAVASCINLKTITLPAGLTIISKLALSTCYKLETIYFKGTTLQWEAVTKEAYWDDLSGSSVGGYQVVCLGNESCTHDWQEATCESPRYCPLCGSTEGETLGHDYNAAVTVPTCVEAGYTTYTCSRCGDSYEADPVPATGQHTYEGGKCSVCGTRKVSDGLEYKLSSDGRSYTVTDIGSCTDTDLIIPATYNDLPVTAISNNAFDFVTSLTSLTLPDSITSIGSMAFYGCTGLRQIDLGSGVTTIMGAAFEACSGLTEVVIPNSVTSVGECAFGDCSNLVSVTIGEGVTDMASHVFRWCEALEKVYFNATAMKDKEYHQSVFHNAGSAGEGIVLYVGANVQKIPAFLFAEYNTTLRPKLVGVEFAEGSVCESIGTGAFIRCYELTSITIADSVTSIGNSAFSGCTAMTEITLSKNLTTLGEYAFSACTALSEIVIPDGVTTIAYGTFEVCTNLTAVTLGAHTVRIGNSAFWGCSQLAAITAPEGVTHIGEYAFYDCSRLSVVYLPQSLTQIGDKAFYNCANLWHVLYRGSQEQWENITLGENSDLLGAVIHYDCTGEEIVDLENQICTLCCEHDYEVTEGKAPTCTEPGGATFTCTLCGHSYTDGDIPPLGHDYAGGCIVETAPREKTAGKLTGACVRCGEPVEAELPKLNITDYSFVLLAAPADGTPGTVRYTWKDTTYGQITVDAAFYYGDANGDGVVNGKDVLLLRSYMANYDYDTGASAVAAVAGADANGDGVVNGKDVLLLRAYMANYDYDTGTSTVALGPKQAP